MGFIHTVCINPCATAGLRDIYVDSNFHGEGRRLFHHSLSNKDLCYPSFSIFTVVYWTNKKAIKGTQHDIFIYIIKYWASLVTPAIQETWV